jgi:nicotinamidase-related amidase
MKRTALLVIDMQNDFIAQVAQARAVVPKILDVLGTFRERRLTVIHILRVHRKDGSDVEIFRKDRFMNQPFTVAGTSGASVIDELSPVPGEYVIEKIRMSAFIGTELDLLLRNLDITELVVTGIQTPNCVRTTVFDAIAYNYNVTLVEDAVGAQTDQIHSANVRDMANVGVRIVKARDVASVL